jgi:hypothetical protein
MSFGRFLLDRPDLCTGVCSQSRRRATLHRAFVDTTSVGGVHCTEAYGTPFCREAYSKWGWGVTLLAADQVCFHANRQASEELFWLNDQMRFHPNR